MVTHPPSTIPPVKRPSPSGKKKKKKPYYHSLADLAAALEIQRKLANEK